MIPQGLWFLKNVKDKFVKLIPNLLHFFPWQLKKYVLLQHFVVNKAKGRISKRVFQKNKARQIFRKTNISYPDTHTYVCVSGVRNVRFSENLACFVFLKHPFWDSPFCLINDDLRKRFSLSV